MDLRICGLKGEESKLQYSASAVSRVGQAKNNTAFKEVE